MRHKGKIQNVERLIIHALAGGAVSKQSRMMQVNALFGMKSIFCQLHSGGGLLGSHFGVECVVKRVCSVQRKESSNANLKTRTYATEQEERTDVPLERVGIDFCGKFSL